MKYIITLMLMVSLINCGTIKVDTKGIGDAIENIADNHSGTSSSSATDSTASGSGTATNADSAVIDDKGQIQTDTPDSLNVDRYFAGSFTQREYQDTCEGFPKVLRIYSYDATTVDIENSSGELITTAEQFNEDDTFTFDLKYLDSLGNPDIILNCTCQISQYDYKNDDLQCICDNEKTSCNLYYGKI